MDFLDPKKHRRHMIQLMVGYVLIGSAILIATVILLELAYGYGLKNGQVIQNGLVFVSSQPNPAVISFNGKVIKARTNTRQLLQSGTYTMRLSLTGYQDWQQTIDVEGGSVAHYDYPFLFPNKLVTTTIKTYSASPSLTTGSPDLRWLLVTQPSNAAAFDMYDLKNPKLAPTVLTVPADVISTGTTQSWSSPVWADDNRHVLVKHSYDGSYEYVLIDRQDPTQSVNLTKTLNAGASIITLLNDKYNQYYVYDASTQVLTTATLANPTETPYLQNVLAYQPYGSNSMLYATTDGAETGKVAIKLLQNGTTYDLRSVSANTSYVLAIAQYSGDLYVGLGASSEGRVYIYKNPVDQLGSSLGLLIPVQVLKLSAPTYLSFSPGSQYVAEENGTQFAVYDALMGKATQYKLGSSPLDVPQAHASWMDGARLDYVSGGKLTVFDFNGTNQHTLMPASASYVPAFGPSYKFVDTLAPANANGSELLTSTALIVQ